MKAGSKAWAAACTMGLALWAVAARAQDEPSSDIAVSGSVTLVSDYRFRGVSQTGGDPAVQGTLDVEHASGFYVGLWASSVSFDKFGPAAERLYGDVELDLYGGWSGEVAPGLTADAGLMYYAYPDGTDNSGVFEPYAAFSTTLGPARVKLGATYAWKQSSLGGMGNLQVYTSLDVGIPSTPLTATARIAYQDGALAPSWQAGANDRTGFDYSLGLSATMRGFTLGVSYIGSDGPNIDRVTDDAVVASLSYSF